MRNPIYTSPPDAYGPYGDYADGVAGPPGGPKPAYELGSPEECPVAWSEGAVGGGNGVEMGS